MSEIACMPDFQLGAWHTAPPDTDRAEFFRAFFRYFAEQPYKVIATIRHARGTTWSGLLVAAFPQHVELRQPNDDDLAVPYEDIVSALAAQDPTGHGNGNTR